MKTRYTNARIYTVNSDMEWAEEMVVENGKITYVGSKQEHGDEEIVDCGGKMLMPSFVDSHCHPGWIAESAWHIVLPIIEDVDELLTYIKNYAQEHPELKYLYFDYYMTELFDGNGPTKELLDRAVCDRPCLVADFTEHMCWVNSKFIELAGIDKDTPDLDELRVFWRDEEGNPTGWIKEMAYLPYINNVYDAIGWRPPASTSEEGIAPVHRQIHEWGYTGMYNAFLINEDEIKNIYELDRKGILNFYYDATIRADSVADLPAKLRELDELKAKYSTEHITFNSVKLFVDGTMASGNAAMLKPLCNYPDEENYGKAALDEEDLEQYFLIANEAGYDVHMHVVGDRSFRMICDCVEKIKNDIGDAWKIRCIIAHACLVDKSDRVRPAELGIYMNVTPHWNAGMYGESALAVIGEKRWRQQAGYNEMINTGAHIAFSSDTTSLFEFNRSNPLMGIQCGATRVDPEYPLDPEKYPGSIMPEDNQKIEVAELIKGFTIGGARQMRIDYKTGSLEAGKSADFIILSDNIFEVDKEKIIDISVEKVFFEGKELQ